MKNSDDNVFSGLLVGPREGDLVTRYLGAHDFSAASRRAIRHDLRKFVTWFVEHNHERFTVDRITTRDVTDFRSGLRNQHRQAVATVNRALVTIRRYLA